MHLALACFSLKFLLALSLMDHMCRTRHIVAFGMMNAPQQTTPTSKLRIFDVDHDHDHEPDVVAVMCPAMIYADSIV